jgi:TRAP-type C4-dicarboxylate transport system substrate-binding protein
MKNGWRLVATLATVVAAGAIAAPARAQSYKAEYRVSTVVGNPFPWFLSAQKWADLVKERTAGRIAMKIYPGTSLVGGDQTKSLNRKFAR